ncbi:hypothetical protein BHM03_00013914 [Ensete ventricosum]|nr:hypothetical protein BHM03_00013914 [Ensete ventricosum]
MTNSRNKKGRYPKKPFELILMETKDRERRNLSKKDRDRRRWEREGYIKLPKKTGIASRTDIKVTDYGDRRRGTSSKKDRGRRGWEREGYIKLPKKTGIASRTDIKLTDYGDHPPQADVVEEGWREKRVGKRGLGFKRRLLEAEEREREVEEGRKLDVAYKSRDRKPGGE